MKDRGKATLKRLQEDAERANADRANRTPAQQLAKLDAKLGKDIGATRERARLAKAQVPVTAEGQPKTAKEIDAEAQAKYHARKKAQKAEETGMKGTLPQQLRGHPKPTQSTPRAAAST